MNVLSVVASPCPKVKVLLLLFICHLAMGQYPLKVGDPIPRELWQMPLKTVSHPGGKDSITLASYQDKPLVLDFWGTYCQPCIAGLPKLDSLQKMYAGQLSFVQLSREKQERLTGFYTKIKQQLKLGLISCKADDRLFEAFEVSAVSTYVWINKQGIVTAITGQEGLNGENIQRFLNAEALVAVVKAEALQRKFYTLKDPYLQDAGQNGDSVAVRFSSVLSGYNSKLTSGIFLGKNKIWISNSNLMTLCRIAWGEGRYTGGFPYWQTRIQLTGSQSLLFPKNYNEKTEQKDLYCYELISPQKDQYLLMQQDMKRYFGLSGCVSQQKITCLALETVSESPTYPSQGQQGELDHSLYWLTAENREIRELTGLLGYYLQHDSRPVVDETGYKGKISLSLKGRLSDLQVLNRELARYGLKLSEQLRSMPVLTITND